MTKRFTPLMILFLAVAALSSAEKPAKKIKTKVLDRVRLDVLCEDLEYVTNGPLAGRLAILDESHVYGIQADGSGNSKVKLLFDMPDFPGRPNGIAYVDSLGLFAIDTRDNPGMLYFVDHKGRPQFELPIQYLDDYWPNFGVEGLAYIPETSGFYPDHLVLVTADYDPDDPYDPGNGRLQIIDLDGQVVKSILVPPEIINGVNLGAVTFQPPDSLLIGIYSSADALYTLDFDGNLRSTIPCSDCEELVLAFEGLARTSDGLIIGAGTFGNLVFFDENVDRLRELDVVYAANLGLNSLRGIAWDSQNDQFLVLHRVSSDPGLQFHIAAVPPELDSATELADIDPQYWRAGGLAYLPFEDHIATRHFFGGGADPSILIFGKTGGSPIETIDLTHLDFGLPRPVTYIPGTDQFAVSFSNRPTFVEIVDRSGDLIDSFDLADMGVTEVRAVVHADSALPRGGRFLINAAPGRRVLIADSSMNVVGEFDAYSEFGLTRIQFYDLVAITSGKYAGTFGIIGDSGELIIFSIK